MAGDRYLRALRFRALTGLYDPLVRATTRESEFESRFLDQAALEPDQRVLDLGCGTGTLAIEAKRGRPRAAIVGLDGDPEMLERGRRKADDAGAEIELDQGYRAWPRTWGATGVSMTDGLNRKRRDSSIAKLASAIGASVTRAPRLSMPCATSARSSAAMARRRFLSTQAV
jgi:SAM-dependent methyltransferase